LHEEIGIGEKRQFDENDVGRKKDEPNYSWQMPIESPKCDADNCNSPKEKLSDSEGKEIY